MRTVSLVKGFFGVCYKQFIYKFLLTPSSKKFLHEDIPYFSQWESRQLVDKIITKKMSAKDDPLWRSSGAKTKEEYELWSWNCCGMACLKSVLAKELNEEIPIVTLGKKCMSYGGYRKSLVKGNIDGLFYRPFLRFIQDEFELRGSIRAPLILKEIIYELHKGNYIFASVSPKIRDSKDSSKEKNGHLILLLGYDLEKKILYLNNPSGNTKTNQEYANISFADFSKFFGRRGIVIYRKNGILFS